MGGKGQTARQGRGKPARGFEGGQMPLSRRLPKRGFSSLEPVEYAIINVRDLQGFSAGTVIDPELLRSRGLVKKGHEMLKVLGDGDLSIALSVRAHQFSKSAIEKINGAGGTVELIER
jgi:large subunit ribosomal protein L15